MFMELFWGFIYLSYSRIFLLIRLLPFYSNTTPFNCYFLCKKKKIEAPFPQNSGAPRNFFKERGDFFFGRGGSDGGRIGGSQENILKIFDENFERYLINLSPIRH